MGKYGKRYRVDSLRLKNWDYRRSAAYFITIVTQNRQNYFGDILDNNLQLNLIGKIASDCWLEIPRHFPFVQLGDFVIMPNHMHGILILGHHSDNENPKIYSSYMGKISPKPGSVSTIIRSYKSAVSKMAHNIQSDFRWQSRFYDHIIRDWESYQRISKYIENNPVQWIKLMDGKK